MPAEADVEHIEDASKFCQYQTLKGILIASFTTSCLRDIQWRASAGIKEFVSKKQGDSSN